MAKKISDLIEAMRRRKAEEETMARPDPNFEEGATAPRSFEEAGVPLPNTSTWKSAAAPVAPAPRQPGRGLSDALTGAAYGIQAAAGPTAPGQEWRKGLLGGVVGTGMGAAADARAAQLKADRENSMEGKLGLLMAKDAMRDTPEEAALRVKLAAEAKLETDLTKIREGQKLVRDRIDAARNASIAGAKDEKTRKGYEWAWGQVRVMEKRGDISEDDKEQRQMAEVFLNRWLSVEGGGDNFKDIVRK